MSDPESPHLMHLLPQVHSRNAQNASQNLLRLTAGQPLRPPHLKPARTTTPRTAAPKAKWNPSAVRQPARGMAQKISPRQAMLGRPEKLAAACPRMPSG